MEVVWNKENQFYHLFPKEISCPCCGRIDNFNLWEVKGNTDPFVTCIICNYDIHLNK